MTTTFDWSLVAPAWDTHRDQIHHVSEPVVDALLAALDLQPGERVLEVAAGTGELSRRMAQIVGLDGQVIASDAAPGMVDLMRRTLQPHEGSTLQVRRLDACDTGAASDSVDAVVCQMGLMFVLDPAAALREWYRVMAPGARLAVAVWAGPEHNPWLANVGMSAMMHGVYAGGPPTAPGGVFSLGDPERLVALVTACGFGAVVLDEVAAPAAYGSSDEHFDSVTAVAGPLAVAVSAASDDERATVRAAVSVADAPFTTEDGVVLPGRALVVRARRIPCGLS